MGQLMELERAKETEDNMKIKDTRPQVGIFEIVDGVMLSDTEDTSDVSMSGRYFSGNQLHLHAQVVKTLVKHAEGVKPETKAKFESDSAEYLKWPRGRVDYDIVDKEWHIMAAKKFFTVANVELVTREFHLPPYSSGRIVLEADDGHYGY